MGKDTIGLSAFLSSNPEMVIAPYESDELVLEGIFRFRAQCPPGPTLSDFYHLEICIPKNFPAEIPTVKELDEKIPRDGEFHVNPGDTLCLGSPLRIRRILRKNPTVSSFVTRCLLPFLYGVTWKKRCPQGSKFYMGELAHGTGGLFDDYRALLGLSEKTHVIRALSLICLKKREANKLHCPCGCSRKLANCKKRYIINWMRLAIGRRWARGHIEEIKKQTLLEQGFKRQ